MSLFSLACAYVQRTMIRRTLQPVIQGGSRWSFDILPSQCARKPVKCYGLAEFSLCTACQP